MSALCACGCGEALVLGGRYRTGHSAVRPISPRYIVDEHGCWVWQRAISNQGYAMLWQDGRNRMAHRIYYAECHGECPPTLDHLCRNRACVNPAHLEPCGRGENVRRGEVAVLDWQKVAEIRELADQMEGSQRAKSRTLAPLFGVSHHAVKNILLGQRWSEEARPA